MLASTANKFLRDCDDSQRGEAAGFAFATASSSTSGQCDCGDQNLSNVTAARRGRERVDEEAVFSGIAAPLSFGRREKWLRQLASITQTNYTLLKSAERDSREFSDSANVMLALSKET